MGRYLPLIDGLLSVVFKLLLGLSFFPSLCNPVGLNAATRSDDGLRPDVPYSPGQLHGREA